MALASGIKLGPYEIQSRLGAGGMGEVYRARDTRLDPTVAIKILASHLSSSLELKQRMEREARAISSLNHPNICHLYDIGSQDGADFLVMELLEGNTLADRLRGGALPLADDQLLYPNDWSRDGKYIFYSRGLPGTQEIWALPLEGDRKPFQVVPSTPITMRTY